MADAKNEKFDFYPVFEDNQVLTACQLNRILFHLDKLDKLTRAKILGTGVAYGLAVKTGKAGNAAYLDLTAGYGITQEGFLLYMPDTRYTHYREPYKLTENYAPFMQGDKFIALTQLIAEDELGLYTDEIPLKAEILENKVVVLFAEELEKTIKSCTDNDCDFKGKRAQIHFRLFLVDENNLVFNNLDHFREERKTLPELFVKRITGLDHVDSYSDLYALYLDAIENLEKGIPPAFATIHNLLGYICPLPAHLANLKQVDFTGKYRSVYYHETLRNLELARKQIYRDIDNLRLQLQADTGLEKSTLLQVFNAERKTILSAAGAAESGATAASKTTSQPRTNGTGTTGKEVFASLIRSSGTDAAREKYATAVNPLWQKLEELEQSLLRSAFYSVHYVIQYYYDFLKDLVDAYRELKSELVKLYTNALLPDQACPRHVLLGKIIAVGTVIPRAEDFSRYRHSFAPAPVLQKEGLQQEKVLHLAARLSLLLESFSIPAPDKADIFITPSRGRESVLGERSIPYYFKVNSLFMDSWNFSLYIAGQSGLILSYYYQELHNSTLKKKMLPAFLVNPFDFSIDNYPLFLIEGHTGKELAGVEDNLQKAITAYNLPFQLLTLKLGINTDDIAVDDFQFPDVDSLYHFLSRQLICRLDNILEFFNELDSAGENSAGITGIVLKAENNEAINGASVYLLNQTKELSDTERLSAAKLGAAYIIGADTTDKQGTFRIDNLKPGTYRLAVYADGYTTWSAIVQLFAGKLLGMSLIKLNKKGYAFFPYSITGYIRSAVMGNALAGAQVLLVNQDNLTDKFGNLLKKIKTNEYFGNEYFSIEETEWITDLVKSSSFNNALVPAYTASAGNGAFALDQIPLSPGIFTLIFYKQGFLAAYKPVDFTGNTKFDAGLVVLKPENVKECGFKGIVAVKGMKAGNVIQGVEIFAYKKADAGSGGGESTAPGVVISYEKINSFVLQKQSDIPLGFAVTNEKGEFEISTLTDKGNYILEFRHNWYKRDPLEVKFEGSVMQDIGAIDMESQYYLMYDKPLKILVEEEVKSYFEHVVEFTDRTSTSRSSSVYSLVDPAVLTPGFMEAEAADAVTLSATTKAKPAPGGFSLKVGDIADKIKEWSSNEFQDLFKDYIVHYDSYEGFAAYILFPVDIVNWIKEIIKLIPEKITELDWTKIKTDWDTLTGKALTYKENLLNLQADVVSETRKCEIIYYLNLLLHECSLYSLEKLAAYYAERRQEIRESRLLKNFILKHPGAEHTGGVCRGGTFILLYTTYNDKKIVAGDLSLCYYYYPQSFDTGKSITGAPVVFKLPRDTFTPGDPLKYKFILNPPGGVVEGPGVEPEPTTGDYYFVPGIIALDMVPGTLTFTYTFNTGKYQCQVLLEKEAPAALSADFQFEIVSVQLNKEAAVVSFTAVEVGADEYAWNFDDGLAEEILKTNKAKTWSFSIKERSNFQVKLRVKKGEMTAEKVHALDFDKNAIDAAFKIEIMDPVKRLIKLTPADKRGTKYEWKLDNETISDSQEAFTYTCAGTKSSFKVTLKVTKDVYSDSETQEFTFPSMLNFEIEKTDIYNDRIVGKVKLVTTLDNKTGNYQWDLGDGNLLDGSKEPVYPVYNLLEGLSYMSSVKVNLGEAWGKAETQLVFKEKPDRLDELEALLKKYGELKEIKEKQAGTRAYAKKIISERADSKVMVKYMHGEYNNAIAIVFLKCMLRFQEVITTGAGTGSEVNTGNIKERFYFLLVQLNFFLYLVTVQLMDLGSKDKLLMAFKLWMAGYTRFINKLKDVNLRKDLLSKFTAVIGEFKKINPEKPNFLKIFNAIQ